MMKGKEIHGGDSGYQARSSEMRKRGQDPFQPHDVNFFFALPNEPACTAINKQLESEGFSVDVKQPCPETSSLTA